MYDINLAVLDEDFAAIRTAVGSCAALVALIGPGWATATGRKGHGLHDPNDRVRLEIQTALERNVQVIPVLVDGATMPQERDLPSELHKLVQLQALVLMKERPGSEVEYDAHQIIDVIQQVLGVSPDAGQAPTAGPGTLLRGNRWLRGARARAGRSVFISFRHELSENLARLVQTDLDKHGYDTFVAIEDLGSGEFERVILSQIEMRQHFVVLLEPRSLDRIGKDGDWLRREIAHALRHGRNVVPVTASGFEFSDDLVLPPDVAKLSHLNAVPIPPKYFNAAMEDLRTKFLKKPSNP
jgi:hypothetical protein